MAPRKTPFSGKAKKQQLQAKREKNRAKEAWSNADASTQHEQTHADAAADAEVARAESLVTATLPPTTQDGRRDLRTVFHTESKAAVDARKRDATRALEYAPDAGNSQSIYALGIQFVAQQPPILLKPTWHRDMSPDDLAHAEQQAYLHWTQALADAQQTLATERQRVTTDNTDDDDDDAAPALPKINLYERNLEVWRQLWRVLDRSAVIVHLADARCPLLHLSDRLIRHIVADRPSKRVVIVLTKADLVAPDRVAAWIVYLEKQYAAYGIRVFAYSLNEPEISTAALLQLIGSVSAAVPRAERDVPERLDERDALIVGFVGEPNVGKSSLLNSLFGRKLVSVSATPGHTKHLQTHFFDRIDLLQRPDDDGVTQCVMCDCPGVVFPRFDVPIALQILFGSFPIAQTREPFSAVRFIAENCVPPLHVIYKLKRIDDDDDTDEWSPFALCESYAQQRGFHVKRGKLDVHRAANLLLRDTLNGKKAVLSFPPPDMKDDE